MHANKKGICDGDQINRERKRATIGVVGPSAPSTGRVVSRPADVLDNSLPLLDTTRLALVRSRAIVVTPRIARLVRRDRLGAVQRFGVSLAIRQTLDQVVPLAQQGTAPAR
jgi:hypothetical protein